MAKKNGFVAFVDELPYIVKLLLCIPALNIVWALYRIIKGATEQNIVVLVIGIVWIIGAISIGWLVDLIALLVLGHPIFA